MVDCGYLAPGNYSETAVEADLANIHNGIKVADIADIVDIAKLSLSFTPGACMIGRNKGEKINGSIIFRNRIFLCGFGAVVALGTVWR